MLVRNLKETYPNAIETCTCSINAVHPAWNCPTCNGRGFLLKKSIKTRVDNILKDLEQEGYIEFFKGKINIPDQ